MSAIEIPCKKIRVLFKKGEVSNIDWKDVDKVLFDADNQLLALIFPHVTVYINFDVVSVFETK